MTPGDEQAIRQALEEMRVVDGWAYSHDNRLRRDALAALDRLAGRVADLERALREARQWIDDDRRDAIEREQEHNTGPQLREAAEGLLAVIDAALAREAVVPSPEQREEQGQEGDARFPGVSGTAPTEKGEVEG